MSIADARRPSGRSFLLDVLKAAGCILIVLHHLSFYGPMSDVVMFYRPELIDWLTEYGRVAVQVFLVCSGYLTASAWTARPVVSWRGVLQLAWHRYLRLSLPLLAALSVAVLVTEAVRPGFDHPSLSSPPQWEQAVAHVLLLQHLFDLEALSAGVWYVSIDFQLYGITLLVLWLVSVMAPWRSTGRVEALRVQWMLGLTVLSLIRWNVNPDLDVYGLYFFGAYGMGWLAYRARLSRIPPKGWAVLLALGGLAWWVDPRLRITTAWAVALLLALAPDAWLRAQVSTGWRWLISALARISYSVFLIHYAMILLVSAWVTAHWPHSLFWNAAGMGAVVVLSILAGAVLYHLTEKHRPDGRRWLLWVAVFMGSTALAMLPAQA